MLSTLVRFLAIFARCRSLCPGANRMVRAVRLGRVHLDANARHEERCRRQPGHGRLLQTISVGDDRAGDEDWHDRPRMRRTVRQEHSQPGRGGEHCDGVQRHFSGRSAKSMIASPGQLASIVDSARSLAAQHTERVGSAIAGPSDGAMNGFDVQAIGWVVTRDACAEIVRGLLGSPRRMAPEATAVARRSLAHRPRTPRARTRASRSAIHSSPSRPSCRCELKKPSTSSSSTC